MKAPAPRKRAEDKDGLYQTPVADGCQVMPELDRGVYEPCCLQEPPRDVACRDCIPGHGDGTCRCEGGEWIGVRPQAEIGIPARACCRFTPNRRRPKRPRRVLLARAGEESSFRDRKAA
jgi:hypothetical protein